MDDPYEPPTAAPTSATTLSPVIWWRRLVRTYFGVVAVFVLINWGTFNNASLMAFAQWLFWPVIKTVTAMQSTTPVNGVLVISAMAVYAVLPALVIVFVWWWVVRSR